MYATSKAKPESQPCNKANRKGKYKQNYDRDSTIRTVRLKMNDELQ